MGTCLAVSLPRRERRRGVADWQSSVIRVAAPALSSYHGNAACMALSPAYWIRMGGQVLWGNPELLDSIYVSRVHPRAEGERAAWAILSILCRNPLWLLVASCCSASVRNRLPTCGRPMQVLLAFLGGPCCSSSPTWVSLRAGCSSRPLAQCCGIHVQCRRGTDVTWTGTPYGAVREGRRRPSG